MPIRRESPSEINGSGSFKEALHETIYRSSLPCKAIADILGVGVRYLGNVCDTEQQDAWLSSRHLTQLALSADNFAWLDFFERLAGRVAVRVPSGSGAGELHALGRLARETGEVMTGVATALEDECISLDELRRIDKTIDGAMRALAAVSQFVHRMAEQSGTTPATSASATVRGCQVSTSGEGHQGWSGAACGLPTDSQRH